jgi:hypothetical protein
MATVTIRSQGATTRPGRCADLARFTNVAEHSSERRTKGAAHMKKIYTLIPTAAGFVGVTLVTDC